MLILQNFDIKKMLPTSNNPENRQLPILMVFAECIRYLRDQLVDTVTKAYPSVKFKEKDFQWILTVPAIWKSSARQLMREAAIEVTLRHSSK